MHTSRSLKASALPWIIVVAATALALCLSWRSLLNYQSYFGMYHDDGIYVVTARALSEGAGYRIISLPGEPLQSKYPPGYPAILAAIWLLASRFPANLITLSAAQTILSLAAAWIAAAYLVATRKVTPLLGAVILGASLLNSHYIDFAPMLMSDLPCALFAILALWLTERQGTGQFSMSGALALAAALALPGLVRTVGAIVIPCAAIYLAARKRWKLALVSCSVALAILLPLLVWQQSAGHAQDPFIAYYTTYLSHAYQTLPSDSSLVRRVWENYNWSGVLQINTYFPFLSRIPFQALSPVAFWLTFRVGYLLLGLPLVIGGLRELWRLSLPGLYCFLYAAVLTYWPMKLEWRHILPLLPLNYYLYFRGLRVAGKMVKPGFRRAPGLYRRACAAGAALFATYLVAGAAAESLPKAGRYGVPWLGRQAQDLDYSEAYRWIETNTASDDTFVCNNDPLLFLHTGRKAVFPSRMELWRFARNRLVDPRSLLEAIDFSGASYVVNDPTYRTMGLATQQTAESVQTLTQKHPGSLVPVFTSSHGLVTIYAVNRDALPSAADVRL